MSDREIDRNIRSISVADMLSDLYRPAFARGFESGKAVGFIAGKNAILDTVEDGWPFRSKRLLVEAILGAQGSAYDG